MAVSQNCSVDSISVKLKLTEGQQLRYTITEDAGVLFDLQNGHNTTLLPKANEPAVRVKLWPENATENPAGNDVSHPLGITFGDKARLRWQIDRIAADGSVLQQVKDCVYVNDADEPDSFFDAIRIFIQ